MTHKTQMRQTIDVLRLLALTLLLGINLGIMGCAGMPAEYSRDLGVNSLLWGAIGSGAGAGIAAVTGNDPVQGAVFGGLGGAALGAANTPCRSSVCAVPAPRHDSYGSSAYERAYWQEIERLRREEFFRQQALERERGRNNARRDFYSQ